jgi:hypothetical protein
VSPPLLFCEIKLIYIFMCTLSLLKGINNKPPCVVTFIEGVYQMCVCQGEYGQPYSSWLSYVVSS